MIVRTRGGDLSYRTSLADLGISRSGVGSSAGMNVTPVAVSGIPAVHAAVTFASEAIAVLPLCVWRDEGPAKRKVKTTWQGRLFSSPMPNPTQTWFTFWETVQSALDYRSNAFIWKTKDATGRVLSLWALHPDQVYPWRESQTKKIIYRVVTGGIYPTPTELSLYASVLVDSGTMLHIRGRGGIGEILAPTPIETFRTALGITLAKQEHEAQLYKNGALGGLGVSFPEGVSLEKARQWKQMFDAEHAGTSNAGKTKVVGSGASMTQIGMTQADAQFVESVALSVLDVARIFRVPATFLEINPKAEKLPTPELEQQRWFQHGLNPRMTRIESAFNADPDIFGGSDYPAFDTAGLIRGDVATEDRIAHNQIQDGRLLVDEWRIPRGLKPLPGGLGAVPQITPVGGAPNPINQGG